MLYGLWEKWKALAHVIGNFQARLLLSLFYYLLLSPFGLAVKLFSDPLRIKKRGLPRWLPRVMDPTERWEKARRQF